mgnify:CR=1 FL=1
MASAYGTFANKGVHVKPTAIVKILDRNGNVLEDESTLGKEENKTRVMSEKEAYEMTVMLEGVIDYGTGTAAALGRPAAGKTGTTDDNKDAWFVGYTPDIVTAVWIGDDTGAHSLGEVYGGTIPAEIWKDYMSSAAADEPTGNLPFRPVWNGCGHEQPFPTTAPASLTTPRKKPQPKRKNPTIKKRPTKKPSPGVKKLRDSRQKKHEDSRKTATIKHSNAKRAAAPTRVQLLFFSVSWQLFFSHIDKGQSRRLRHFLNRSITHFFVEPDIGPAFRTSI